MPRRNPLGFVRLEDRTTPATFTVTTVLDNGNDAAPAAGSLRQAILGANAAAGADAISFAIVGGGVQVITPATPLPVITDTVTIDGTTQTGFAGTPVIRLSGTAAGAAADGLVFRNHTGSTLRGFSIGGFGGAGVKLDGGGSHKLFGNFVGTSQNGTAAAANGVGVLVTNGTAGNTVGGPGADRNVIGGNATAGVRVEAAASQNTITGNFIGTGITGAAAVPNVADGIFVTGGATETLVGGFGAGAGNVIAGNDGNGVRVSGAATAGTRIAGNRIGLGASGSPLANAGDGIRIDTAAGTAPVGGVTSTTGTSVFANTISQNAGNGLSVRDTSRYVRVAQTNAFFGNTGLGILVEATANDGLAAPVVSAATPTATGLTVAGTLIGRPSTAYDVTVYTNSAADPTGVGEGQVQLGTTSVTTAADGTAAFALTTTGGTPTGQFVTATSTATAAGDTSAFSKAFGTPVPGTTTRGFAVGSGGGTSTAVVYRGDGSQLYTVNPFTSGVAVRTAVADFNNDGVPDLVAATGPGTATMVRVFDGKTRAELFQVQPFEAAFTGGVYVAAGDVTGDGTPDLIISPDEGGGPRVDVYNGSGFGKILSFFGIDDPNFRGGARVAVGDINGDKTGDLIVVAGVGGGPRVAGYTGQSIAAGKPAHLFSDFFAFEQTLRNGVFVTSGDTDGDGCDEVIVGGGPGGGPRVTTFSAKSLAADDKVVPIANFFAGPDSLRGGVRVASRDFDLDGLAEIVTGPGPGGSGTVNVYAGFTLKAGSTPTPATTIDPFPGSTAGVFVG